MRSELGPHRQVAKSKTKVWLVTLNLPGLRPPWMSHLSVTAEALLWIL